MLPKRVKEGKVILIMSSRGIHQQAYKPPARPQWAELIDALEQAGSALARFDERLKRIDAPLSDGILGRLAYREAYAAIRLSGRGIMLDDLIFYDAGATRGDRDIYLAHLALRDLRNFTRRTKPGWEMLSDKNLALLDGRPFARLEGEALQLWRDTVMESEGWPQLLRAAIAWHAWHHLDPFHSAEKAPRDLHHYQTVFDANDADAPARGAWIGAALLLETKTCSIFPPTISGLGVFRPRSEHSFEQSAAGFMSWITASCEAAYRELDRLTLARTVMLQAVGQRRSNHHARDVIDLLMRSPVISAPMAAKMLHVSTRTIERVMPLLGSSVHEKTGNKSYRLWSII